MLKCADTTNNNIWCSWQSEVISLKCSDSPRDWRRNSNPGLQKQQQQQASTLRLWRSFSLIYKQFAKVSGTLLFNFVMMYACANVISGSFLGCGRITHRGRNGRFWERMSNLVKLAFMDASNQVMIFYFTKGVPCMLGKRVGIERNPLIPLVSELERFRILNVYVSELIQSNFCKSVVGTFQNPSSCLFSILRKLERFVAICSLKIAQNTKAAVPTYCFCKTSWKLQTRF